MTWIDLDGEVRRALESFGEPPRVILTGKTGAGKSSLLNAIMGRHIQEVDVVPCTMDEAEIDWDAGAADLKLLDVPGFAEADVHAQRVSFILDRLAQAHVALLVIGAPDRALEHERRFVEDIRSVEDDIPLLVVGNRIDLLPPVRRWNPLLLNLIQPRTEKERNIVAWSDEVRRATRIPPERLRLVAAGESWDAHSDQHGIDDLKIAIFDLLPEAARNIGARALKVDELRHRHAMRVIRGSAVAAATAALVPVPITAAPIITTIQIQMVISVALLYGLSLDHRKAMGLLGPALASFAGPMAFEELLKLLPGLGQLLGPGIAGSITLAIGWTYLELFIHGNFAPSAEEIRNMLRQKYEEAKHHQQDLRREARSSSAPPRGEP
ncbi:MAG TPA: DUF697 domain-containing protein [Deltaproteobacteria bacterium]|nr:DUF697 domain-containing protein [Deltaproteobacteria bacterium]